MGKDEIPLKSIGLGILVVIVILGLLITIFGSWYIVSKGKAGCVFSNTNGWDYTEKSQGWHFKTPVVENVDKMSFQTQTLGLFDGGEGQTTVLTPKDKNGINFNVDVTIRYRLDQKQICEFIEQKGKDPEALLLTALRADSTRGVFGQYIQEDVPEQRIDIATKILGVLQKRVDSEASGQLKPGFIIIEAVDLRNVQFNERIENAIVSKQEQKQIAEEKEYFLQQATKQKEIDIVNAEAAKRANIIVAEGNAEAIILENTAKAVSIQKINDAYAGMNWAYVEVKYAEALKAVATEGNSVVMDLGRFQSGTNMQFLDLNKLMTGSLVNTNKISASNAE